MRTTDSIKVTSIVQITLSIYYLISILFVVIGTNGGPIFLANIVLFLFYLFTWYSIIIVPICFFINLYCFLKGRKDPKQKELVGKKWIWIFVWPVITTALFLVSALPFIRAPIFS